MKPVFPLILALAATAAFSSAQAQESPDDIGDEAPPVAAPQVMRQTSAFIPVDARNLASMPALTAVKSLRAMSIGVTRAQLQDDEEAQSALLAWVRGGGVVFLHTDAARTFGFTTVAARESSGQQAGQLFGRTRAAIPFGAHSLLWGTAVRIGEDGQTTRDQDAALAGASAVRTVFYQALSGDHFVVGHPRGVPLLQILEAGARNPVYAAAIAPFGRGWAIVTPNYVEPQRGDGALFATNLLRFAGVPPVPAQPDEAPAPPPDLFVSLPASWIESAANAARGDGFDGAAQAKALVAATPRPVAVVADADNKPQAAPAETERIAPLAVPASERNALWRALSGNALGVRTQVLVLRARLALQAGDIATASQWHARAEEIAPNAAVTKVWGGVLSAGEAATRTLASPVRAQLLVQAVGQWETALRAAPETVAAADATDPMTASGMRSTGVPSVGGVDRDVVTLWAREATAAARLAAAEPPFVTVAGDVVVRFYQGDASLRLALPTATRLSLVSRALGILVEDEELLLFASPAQLVAYRAARGSEDGSAPAGIYGDISGSKILMVARPTGILFLPPIRPNGPRRPVQLGSSMPILIGRLHGQVLVNRLAAMGAPVPVWLRVGMESLVAQQVVGETAATANLLRAAAATGQLLTPAQFEAVATNGGLTEAQSFMAESQAESVVQFFIAQQGAGTLVETLQRLGAGQDIDNALGDIAGTNQDSLFSAWSKAAFGA